MKLNPFRLLPLFIPLAIFVSCEDDISPIGNGIVDSQVAITVDSAAFNLNGRTVKASPLDTRSTTTLLGSINTGEYGSLNCSFVTQLLPAMALTIPDSIPLENITDTKLLLRFPKSGITGDSLAPQQVKVYHLKVDLPANLSSDFDIEGKYESNPIASVNYTLSGMALGDSIATSPQTLNVHIPLDNEYGKRTVEQYRKDASIFEWPSKFNDIYKGLYLKSTFGKGCIANVSNASIYAYYTYKANKVVIEDDTSVVRQVNVTDSMCLFTTAPEVLSATLLNYKTSQAIDNLKDEGKAIITTPGGYISSINFPAAELLEDYWKSNIRMSVINSMKFSIPAKAVKNSLGIGVPPSLLMVKKSEIDDFFAQSKVPDNKNSFIADYSSTTGTYDFSSMREYIRRIANDYSDGKVPADETEFMLVPVLPTYEVATASDGSTNTYVTSCVSYVTKPTMVELDTEHALIVLIYSNQYLK